MVVILFKPEHVAPILEGRKTQTRRLGKKRWNVGAVHQARTKMLDPGSRFASLRIVDVRQERLIDISHEDVLAEGYQTAGEYWRAFGRINGSAPRDAVVWVVEFSLSSEGPKP